MLQLDDKDLEKFVIIGDRVLIKPTQPNLRTKSGLYLPESAVDKEKLTSGYVLKVGPGYPIPSVSDDDDFWKGKNEEVRYIPVQPKEGDLAVFLQNSGYEIQFRNEKYVVVPQNAILFVVRDEELMG